jgi:CDP-paratose 2-epimerase
VYSIAALVGLPLKEGTDAFQLDTEGDLPAGVSARGIGVEFSTSAPVSLYGATKLASEAVALEYGEAFGFPVWINRCGVLAGPGQFGTPEQGIVAYWINAHLRRRPMRYLGFNGTGKQVRDAMHPRDLAALLDVQMRQARTGGQRIYTAGGGPPNTMSLAQLTAWCDARFGAHPVEADARERAYDIPWVVMDNTRLERHFGWQPDTPLSSILEEIAVHAEANPDWLERSGM